MTAVIDPPVTSSSANTGQEHDPAPRLGSQRNLGQALAAPAIGADRMQLQAARLSLVRWTRTTAVAITILIGVASFVLSFSSLCDLAARTAWPGWLAWLWPVIVDGTIILATMALVAFSAYPEQRNARRYFWVLLVLGAAVSVSGNAMHAVIPNPALPDRPFGDWFAAAVACVPPIALVLLTHALSILWRFTPYEKQDEQAQLQDSAMALAAERLEKWDAVAAAVHERGLMTSQPTNKIADVLRLLHDEQPPLSLRQVGQRVDLRHDTVGRIRDAARAVLDQDV